MAHSIYSFSALSTELKQELINWEQVESLLTEIAQTASLRNIDPLLVHMGLSCAESVICDREDTVENILKLINEYLNTKCKVGYLYNLQKYLVTSFNGIDFLLNRVLNSPENEYEQVLYTNWVRSREDKLENMLFLDKPLMVYLCKKYPDFASIEFTDIYTIPSIRQVLDDLGKSFNVPLYDNVIALLNEIDMGDYTDTEKEVYVQWFKKGIECRYRISALGISAIISKYTSRTLSEVLEPLSQDDLVMYFARFLKLVHTYSSKGYPRELTEGQKMYEEFSQVSKEIELKEEFRDKFGLPDDVELTGVFLTMEEWDKLWAILDIDSIYPF